MSEQPNPFVVPDPVDPQGPEFSVVDTLLRLDELASGDVRRAEGLAQFATRADLEAIIEALEAELRTLVDDQGRPLDPPGEASIGEETGRTAAVVAAEIQTVRGEYARSFRTVKVRQLDGDAWDEFKIKWRDTIEGDDDAKRNHMLDELVISCAIAPVLDATTWASFRKKYGGVAVEIVRAKAWSINTQSGVSVPKSLLSSVVLRQLKLEQN